MLRTRPRSTIPALVSFDQVFFAPARAASGSSPRPNAGLAALRAGRAPARRSAIARRCAESYDDAPREQVAVLFGDDLANALFGAAPGEWTGPFRSDFGLHAVRLRGRTDARLPPYDEIAARVAEEYAATRRREAPTNAPTARCAQQLRRRRRATHGRAGDAGCRTRDGAVIRAVRSAAMLLALLCAAPAFAHRLSPAFFGLQETAPNVAIRN